MAGGQLEMRETSLRQSWRIGDVAVTKFVDCVEKHDLTYLFPKATTEGLLAVPWLRPAFSYARRAWNSELPCPGGRHAEQTDNCRYVLGKR